MGSSFCDWVIRCCEKYNAVFETNGQQATEEPRHWEKTGYRREGKGKIL